MAATELHSFRCDGDLWRTAMASMAARGLTMTDLLVGAVEAEAKEYEEAQSNKVS